MESRYTLVLGGTGFLGSCIVNELKRQSVSTAVMCRHPEQSERSSSGSVQYFRGDCDDYDSLKQAMRGCRAVIHSAAYYPMYSLRRDDQAARAMRELRNVLRAADRSGVERFVFTSSPMVLAGDAAIFRRCTYHYIKRLLHDEVLQWVDRGFPAILAVPGACFGPGDRKPTTGRLILEIASGRLRFIIEGQMNAVDGRDVASAEVAMLRRGEIGQSYQLGNWNCLLSEFAGLVATLSDVPKPVIHLPYEAARVAARIVEMIQFPLGVATPVFPQSGVDQIHYGTGLDSAPARRDLGFRPRPIEQTVMETIHYFLSVNKLAPRHAGAEFA